jgi:hypothetical protein
MPDEITIAELEKAARNIGRVSGYLGARRNWTLAYSTEEVLSATRDAADSFVEYLTAVMTARQIEISTERQPAPDLLPPAELDASRLEKFTSFLNQLRQWFSRKDDATLPSEGEDRLREIHAALTATRSAAESLLAVAEARRAAADREAAEHSEIVEVDREARLVLEDTDSTPLIQEFKGVAELTPEAKGILQEFVSEHELDLGVFEKRRLQDRVLRWIESTPEGQVLVLKISGLHGRAEVYSSYQPKTSPSDDLIGDLTDEPTDA